MSEPPPGGRDESRRILNSLTMAAWGAALIFGGNLIWLSTPEFDIRVLISAVLCGVGAPLLVIGLVFFYRDR